MANKYIVHTDGGSRGNPGPAAMGVVVEYNGKRREYGEAIGVATNNVAEYRAVLYALKKVKLLLGKKGAGECTVEVRADSDLVVRHMNREFKIKNDGLKEYFIELWNLTQDFKSVRFVHVRREENGSADRLVNRALDSGRTSSRRRQVPQRIDKLL